MRTLSLLVVAVILVASPKIFAVDAASVTFDDSTTTEIEGANVQDALESADGAIAEFHSGVDSDAAIVYVRKDCTGIKNCFTSMANLSGTPLPTLPTHPSSQTNGSWLWGTRKPSAASPILVDVGPGTFEPFVCPDNTTPGEPKFGHITLRGSGREITILKGVTAGIDIHGCFDLDVHDLASVAEVYGARIGNSGSANWHNVDFIAEKTVAAGFSIGWIDDCSGAFPPSTQYLFNCRAIARGLATNKWGYVAGCSETSFFGGEIEGVTIGLLVDDGTEFYAFGSAIRASGPGAPVGVQVNTGTTRTTEFTSHGGLISVSGATGATGLVATNNALANTNGTAWEIEASSGTATRVSAIGTAVVQAPFVWHSGSAEPLSGLVSKTGSDIFVETDCNNTTGVCNGSGTIRPHLMIYDATCSPTPWFDVVTKACRVN